ncbi:hypothetical protein IJ670_05800 [bacterium]|nr:hypothetical protein [bacterium]
MMKLWDLFVTSNAFNFVVFVLIFIYLDKKFHLTSILEGAVQQVKEQIEDAKNAKEHSTQELKKAFKTVSGLNKELEEIEDKTNKNIKKLEENINTSTKTKLDDIQKNLEKNIKNSELEEKSSLTSKIAKASIELAKEHVEHLLQKNPDYHQKFINESIEDLEKLL